MTEPESTAPGRAAPDAEPAPADVADATWVDFRDARIDQPAAAQRLMSVLAVTEDDARQLLDDPHTPPSTRFLGIEYTANAPAPAPGVTAEGLRAAVDAGIPHRCHPDHCLCDIDALQADVDAVTAAVAAYLTSAGVPVAPRPRDAWDEATPPPGTAEDVPF